MINHHYYNLFSIKLNINMDSAIISYIQRNLLILSCEIIKME